MLVMALFNIVDTIYIGRSVGTIGISALTISFPIQMLLTAIAQTIGIGGASLISRTLGEKNIEKANKTQGNVITAVLILSLLLTTLGLVFIDPLLICFGATEKILPYARQYMQIILLGSLFQCFVMAFNNLLRSEGKAKTAMTTMLTAAILNLVLDPIFIFGFKLGMQGAAIATVLAQVLTALYLVYYILSGKSSLKFRIHYLRVDYSIQKEIYAIGVSAFVRQAAGSILMIILNRTLVFYGGELSIAVFGIIQRLHMFAIMPIFGIAQGLQPIAGYNFGAKRFMMTKKVIGLAIIGATIISTIGFFAFLLLPKLFISIFSQDELLLNQGVIAMRLMVIAFPVVGFQIIGAAVFQALGKAMPSFILSMSRQVLFLIPLLLILPHFYSLSGVWSSFPLADILSSIFTFWFLYVNLKKLGTLEHYASKA